MTGQARADHDEPAEQEADESDRDRPGERREARPKPLGQERAGNPEEDQPRGDQTQDDEQQTAQEGDKRSEGRTSGRRRFACPGPFTPHPYINALLLPNVSDAEPFPPVVSPGGPRSGDDRPPNRPPASPPDSPSARIGIVTLTKLTTGAGTENWVVQLVAHCPYPAVSFTIFEADFAPFERIQSADIDRRLGTARRVPLASHWRHRVRLHRAAERVAVRPVRYLAETLLQRLVVVPYRWVNGPRLAAFCDEIDVLYLVDNLALPTLPHRVRCPVVLSTHGGNPVQGPARAPAVLRAMLFRALLRRARGIHYLSESLFAQSPGHLPGDFVAPPGIVADDFPPGEPATEGNRRFLYVARLERSKGIFDVLRAWEQLDLPGATLTIVGTGSAQDAVERAARASSTIDYRGPLDRSELSATYRCHDVLVYPSHQDVFPVVPLEALSAGLGVLTSALVAATLGWAVRIRAVDPTANDAASTATALRAAYDRRAFRRTERLALHREVRTRYDWTVVAPQVLDPLLRLAGKLPHRPASRNEGTERADPSQPGSAGIDPTSGAASRPRG